MRKRSVNVAAANVLSVRKRSGSNNEAAHRTPPGSFALCESEAAATKRPVGTKSTTRFGDEPSF
ncbi:hypothetical protein [Lysinibacillus sp. fls2-241-R2A-57]|uniref:hypothetical protein n=1 Tax=Lysinibacillus sp. fls2-241-R2A-57 TaxID=3040292 RepID=UPI0025528635|nr:hypothetical protein [Lysinibacillus sp. fls2-241-R2A-57]